MAKVAGQAPVKKASKATPAPIKPVKMALTKSALVNLIAEENEIPRKTAAGVYATLENLFSWFGPSAWCRRVRAARSSEGQSTQGSGAQSRHPRPQSRDRRNGRGGGQAGERAGEDPCAVETEDGCEPIVRSEF